MSRDAHRVLDYLMHIMTAIDRIQAYTSGMTETAFVANEMAQDAVIRNLEIIGEACRNIERDDPSFATRHPALPLSAAYEMRNVLAHGYFKVDLGLVWKTLENELPPLKRTVTNLLLLLPRGDGAAPT